MNPLMQRFGLPLAVFGTALYLGWPPSSGLDLGDNVVKAKSVRWKPADLEAPKPLADIVDPFRLVLVVDETKEVEPDTGKLVAVTRPVGPDPEKIKSGLELSGIARLGGKAWAIINGKPSLVGDRIRAGEGPLCEIISIDADHVVLRSAETVVSIRPAPFKQNTAPIAPGIQSQESRQVAMPAAGSTTRGSTTGGSATQGSNTRGSTAPAGPAEADPLGPPT